VESIAQTIGITPTGIGLYKGNKLLDDTLSINQQGIVDGDFLYCIHCILPRHDIFNEISLNMGYARAQHLAHNYSIAHISENEKSELKDLEKKVSDFNLDRPHMRLPAISRYLNIVGKEATFSLNLPGITKELTINDDSIRLKNGDSGVIAKWPLTEIAAVAPAEGGIAISLVEGDLFLETAEGPEIKKTFDAIFEISAWKAGKIQYRKKLTERQDPDIHKSLLEARLLSEKYIQLMKKGQIEVLDLSWSAMHANEIENIALILSADTCIKIIDLSGNVDKEVVISTLLEVAKSSELIEYINLSYCGLQDDFIPKIVDFLQVNKSVKKMNLLLNEFSQDGIMTILEALKTNITVKSISTNVPNFKLAKLGYWLERLYILRELEKVK